MLGRLRYDPSLVAPADASALDERGYAELAPGAVPRELLERLRARCDELFEAEGEAAGSEFRKEEGADRLANLLAKGACFAELLALPALLAHVQCVLGAEFKLASLNCRRVRAGQPTLQPLHADMGARHDSYGPVVCNVLLMLDAYTATSGGLRVVPGSHKERLLPAQTAGLDPLAPHPEQVVVLGPPGGVCVFDASVWHGGLPNCGDSDKASLHVFFVRRDRPQQQWQQRLLPAAVAERLSEEVRFLAAIGNEENERIMEEAERDGAQRSGFLPAAAEM